MVTDLRGSSVPIAQDDKTPPAPPFLINSLPLFSSGEKIGLSGRAEAGSTLRVFHNENKIKEFVVPETSSFDVDVKLSPGRNDLWATSTDPAGNESTSSTWKIIYDIEPPALEVGTPADGASFFGDEKAVNVNGKTEPEAQVNVNDRVAIVNSNGEFSQNIALSEGENTITLIVTDQAENKTEKTLKVTYSP